MNERRKVGDGTPGPGRPKGSRNKLGEAFLGDLYLAWERHGWSAIERVVADKPEHFLKIVASLMPRDLNIKVDPLGHLTDRQLIEKIRALDAAIQPMLSSIGTEADDGHNDQNTKH